MGNLDADLFASTARAAKAHSLMNEALDEYYSACEAADWGRAEQARAMVIGHVEATLDHIAAAYKRLQVAKP